MTFEKFVSDILRLAEECPKVWRKGQAVFNVIETKYGVARAVQFEDGIDCFYDDSKIEAFLSAAWRRTTAQDSTINTGLSKQ